MKPFTPIEQLDAVLKTFVQNDPNGAGLSLKNLAYMSNIIEDDKIISLHHLTLVLAKLSKDEYVEIKKGTDGFKPVVLENLYFITFEGLTFFQQGGYQTKLTYNVKNEKRIIRNEIWLLRGTWAAAIIGFFVLAWYVFQWHYPKRSDFPYYWIWQEIPKKH